MKKVFVFANWLGIGGIESSLLCLLKELNYSQIQVDLYLQNQNGDWMGEIPPQVNLLPTQPHVYAYRRPLAHLRQQRKWGAWLLTYCARYLTIAYYRLICRRHSDEIGFEQLKYLIWSPFLPRRLSPSHYDLALIFGGEPGFARRVDATTSAVWIHTDWSFFHPITWLARLQFRGLPRIVNVSEDAKRAFDAIVPPHPPTQSLVIENVLSPRWIHERATCYRVQPFDGIKLLTVGRVSPPKNPPRALATARELARRGIRFKWYFVGGGESLAALQRLHAQSDLGDAFVIAGATDNPYPYYTWCDIYVCTSDYEGKSVSVREAQIFAKPCIITRFPTSSSQLEDGVDGLIVDCDPIALADAIQDLAANPDRQAALSTTCRQRDYANLGEIQKILSWNP